MTGNPLYLFIMFMAISTIVPLIISKLKKNALTADNGTVLVYPKFLLWFAIFIEVFIAVLLIVIVALQGYREGDWVYMLVMVLFTTLIASALICLALFWKVEMKEDGFERSVFGKKRFYRYDQVTHITYNGSSLYRIYCGKKCFRLESMVIGCNKLITNLTDMGVPLKSCGVCR